MQRSWSTNSRDSDEFSVNLSETTTGFPLGASSYLPVYTARSDGEKKGTALPHHKSTAEKAIHLIPVVLVLCGLILWFSSHPGKL
ncbi:hypothetical protein SLA2020_012080 [Shorea laevis]